MTWADAQAPVDNSGVGVNSLGTSYAGAPTNGTLLVAICNVADGTGLAIAGWTQAFAFVPLGTRTIAVFFKVAAADPALVTVTTTNLTDIAVKIANYSGNDTTAPLDVFVTNETSSGNACYTGLVADPSFKDSLAVMVFGWNAVGNGVIDAMVGDGGEVQIGAQVNANLTHLVAWRHFGTGGDIQPIDGDQYGNGSSGLGASVIFKPAAAVPNDAIASGTGTGVYAQAPVAAFTTGLATVTPTLAGAPTNGNRLVAFVSGRSAVAGVTITPPAGWVQWGAYERFTDNGGSGIFLTTGVFTKIAAGDPAAALFTFSVAQSFATACQLEVAGITTLDLTPAFHSHVHGKTATQGSMRVGTRRAPTPLVGDDFTFAWYAQDTTLGLGALSALSNGFTQDAAAGSALTGVLFHRTSSVPGAMSFSVTVATPGGGNGYAEGTLVLASLGRPGGGRFKGRSYYSHYKKIPPPITERAELNG